jgi:hypothetical protein
MLQGGVFSFSEIVQGRDAGVRVTPDGLLYAVDLTMVVTGSNRDDSGKALRRLSDENFSSDKLTERNTGGSGNSRTKLVTFQNAIELIMVLPGKIAKETRTKFANIITRYLAGDDSLVTEIEANAQSTNPIPQMARASLVAEAVPLADDELYLPYKRKLAELEVAKRETEVQATKIANRAAELANLGIEREHLMACTSGYRELCEDTVMDERARLILKDNFLNMAMLQAPARGSGQGLLGGGGALNPNKPISLSLVVGELGLKIPSNELISIGAELKKRYVEKHGKEPGKHEQLCGGRMTRVNSYMESDRPLLEEVLHWHVAGRV